MVVILRRHDHHTLYHQMVAVASPSAKSETFGKLFTSSAETSMLKEDTGCVS